MESQNEVVESGGRITPSELLTQQEARDVQAAIERQGLSRKTVATSYDLNYDNVRKILARQLVCWPKYADAFNDLLTKAGLSDE